MIELQNENLTLHVDSLGAQMMELRSRHGTQFLWNGDAKYWRDRAPIASPSGCAMRCAAGRWL